MGSHAAGAMGDAPATKTFATPVDIRAGFDANKIRGKSVVITGGAAGLGESFVRAFVKAGAFVTVGDLAEDKGRKLVEDLGEENVAFARCNVLFWSDQVNLFKAAIKHSPNSRVDIVVANAGIAGVDTLWRDDAEGSDEPIEPDLRIFQTNIIGVMYTAKLAVHYFSRQPAGVEGDRCLIITASMAAYLDQPSSPQYAASKWGVRGLMRSLRRTMPDKGMRVNIVAPWFTKTNIMSDEFVAKLQSQGVIFAETEDASSAMLHLASDQSINGHALAILPREQSEHGYMDLQSDHYSVTDIIKAWHDDSHNGKQSNGN